MTNYINMYATIASSGTLGINTDIFETNILNLSVVVGALVYYGRDTVSDIINERKETVLRSLREAENKALEAAERLEIAKKNYTLAESKEKKIRTQGEKSCILAKEALYESLAADLSRIEQSTSFSLRLKQKEYSLDLYNKLLDKSFSFATNTYSKYLTNKRYKKKKFFKKIERLYRMRFPA